MVTQTTLCKTEVSILSSHISTADQFYSVPLSSCYENGESPDTEGSVHQEHRYQNKQKQAAWRKQTMEEAEKKKREINYH